MTLPAGIVHARSTGSPYVPAKNQTVDMYPLFANGLSTMQPTREPYLNCVP